MAMSRKQGCPLSPLLFVILWLSCMMGSIWGKIVGLALPSGKWLRAQALGDDSFLFLKALLANIAKAMEVWNVFAY